MRYVFCLFSSLALLSACSYVKVSLDKSSGVYSADVYRVLSKGDIVFTEEHTVDNTGQPQIIIRASYKNDSSGNEELIHTLLGAVIAGSTSGASSVR